MLRALIIATLLISGLLPTGSGAMEGDICIEKPEELTRFTSEYKKTKKPIGLAVACFSEEMPLKIEETFNSQVPAVENWISLDIRSTRLYGPHIRMDVKSSYHWHQLAEYFKENDIKVRTVALTSMAPTISSLILHETIFPLLEKGGVVVYPECFPTHFGLKLALPLSQQFCEGRYGRHFSQDLKKYHDPQSEYYHNKEHLIKYTLGWIDEIPTIMGWRTQGTSLIHMGKAEKKLETKAYINRIISFNRRYLKKGCLIPEQPLDANCCFIKTEVEFATDYLTFFREYMAEAYPHISYKIYCSAQEQAGELFGAEDYVYPQKGTIKFTGYEGGPSLVLYNQ